MSSWWEFGEWSGQSGTELALYQIFATRQVILNLIVFGRQAKIKCSAKLYF